MPCSYCTDDASVRRSPLMEFLPRYWPVGILEGEGTFMSGPPSAPNSPIARICMTDRDVMARAALLLERAVTSVPARQPHYKPPYITQVKGHDAVGLMRAVRPALGPDRQQQIDRALESWAPPRSRRRRAPNPCTSLEAFKFVADDDRATSWLAGRLEGEGTPSLPRVTPNSAATRLFLFRCATRPWCSGQRESLKDRRSPCESPNEEIGGQRMWRRWVAEKNGRAARIAPLR